jgi:hypothetical protein
MDGILAGQDGQRAGDVVSEVPERVGVEVGLAHGQLAPVLAQPDQRPADLDDHPVAQPLTSAGKRRDGVQEPRGRGCQGIGTSDSERDRPDCPKEVWHQLLHR